MEEERELCNSLKSWNNSTHAKGILKWKSHVATENTHANEEKTPVNETAKNEVNRSERGSKMALNS